MTNQEHLDEALEHLRAVERGWREEDVDHYPSEFMSFDEAVAALAAIRLREPAWLPRVGERVRLTVEKDVMRECVPVGSFGIVIESSRTQVAVRLDVVYKWLAEWENCVIWNPDNVPEDEAELRAGALEVGELRWVAKQLQPAVEHPHDDGFALMERGHA